MRRKKGYIYLTYNDGEQVFSEGSDGNEVYFVVKGEAEISKNIAGRKEIINILTRGDFFGEMAALNGDTRSMTVTAKGKLCLYKLSPDEFLSRMQNNPEFMKDVLTGLVRRLRDTNDRMSELIISILASRREQQNDGLFGMSHPTANGTMRIKTKVPI